MGKRTNVQAFVFTRNPNFKILILKRTPERSGYWQPPCGGVENGEELKKAALREVYEETGIKDIKYITDLHYTFTYSETKNGELMDMQDFCFAVEIDRIPDIKLSEEHEKYKWCSYSEAKEYLSWEHNLVALDKLLDKLYKY